MTINIGEKDPEQGMLGLVIAVVEGIRDTFRAQAARALDSGILDEEQCSRLGRSLLALENALEDIKKERP